ncbi:hypothetical protein C9I49_13140 [Pseudomonas prosekii]|uniref:Uncharacterized protein n=1 Tax=Pseudomonas prosekii TaxID=1148509 RepID=A0A2U2D7W4_9PSED|nr:hypothetical protein C9I49_13140 [Pseudomonas prosekii]
MARALGKRKQANYILGTDSSHALRRNDRRKKKPRHMDRALTCSSKLIAALRTQRPGYAGNRRTYR